jgi:hypothetical protein
MRNLAGEAAPESDFVRGDATGLRIPVHPDALREAGAAWLTDAFRAFGALGPDTRVARIVRADPCPGGSTGQKLFVTVDYDPPRPDLHSQLFVKFSRDFGDPVRDGRGKYEMAGEIRFAGLSRDPSFPINVPAVYFADQQQSTHTGLLITQRIAFGAGAIEPQHLKCMDHELAEPAAYYRAIMRALARIAAAHRSGRLATDIASQFPFDAEAAAAANAIPYDAEQVSQRIRSFAAFVAQHPQLFPAELTPGFFDELDADASLFLQHDAEIRRFQQSDPNLVALCHWNANIDNAWFWRDADGELQCGLMDWGRAGQMNLAYAIWGSLSGAHRDVWRDHFDELLTLFLRELHENGGPRLSCAELELQLGLYIGSMTLGYFIDSPARILKNLPEAGRAAGPFDPIFRASETARNQLHIATNALEFWRTRDVGGMLRRWLRDRSPGR